MREFAVDCVFKRYDVQTDEDGTLVYVNGLPVDKCGLDAGLLERLRERVKANLEGSICSCGQDKYKDCSGRYRCEDCDPPCPECYDGGGPV